MTESSGMEVESYHLESCERTECNEIAYGIGLNQLNCCIKVIPALDLSPGPKLTAMWSRLMTSQVTYCSSSLCSYITALVTIINVPI